MSDVERDISCSLPEPALTAKRSIVNPPILKGIHGPKELGRESIGDTEVVQALGLSFG